MSKKETKVNNKKQVEVKEEEKVVDNKPMELGFTPAKLKDGRLVVIMKFGEQQISIPMEQFLAIAIQVHKFYVQETTEEKNIITPDDLRKNNNIIIP